MRNIYFMVLCSFFITTKGFGQTSTNGGIYVTSDLVAARGDISGLWTWSEANAICNELVDNNFSDWRLPSKEELNFMYGLHSHGSGNFKGMAYWSSTDVKSGFKATQFFHNGSASSGSLGGKYSVRCVRNSSKQVAPTFTSIPPANEDTTYRNRSAIIIVSIIGGGDPLEKGDKSNTVARVKRAIGYTKDNTEYFTEDFSDFIINYKKLNNIKYSYSGWIDRGLICNLDAYKKLCSWTKDSTLFDNYPHENMPVTLSKTLSLVKGGYVVYTKDGNDLIAADKDLGRMNWDDAKKACDELVLNGYSDWYLPSKEELITLYGNLKKEGDGGFADENYWSSSEGDNDTEVWKVSFTSGGQFTANKNKDGTYVNSYVRAVRRNSSKQAVSNVASTPPATSSSNTRESEILYLMINKDVAKAGLNAWSHYQTYGKNEGRIWPNLTKTNTPVNNEINAKLYLVINTDVAEAGLNAWSHYQTYGKNEGRIWPNLKIVSDNNPSNCSISSAMYLLLNNDVAEAGLNAWSHYQGYGKNEGRIWPGCSSTF